MRLQKPGFLRKYLVAARKFEKNPVSFDCIQAPMRLQKPGFLRKYLVAARKFDKNPVSFDCFQAPMRLQKPGFLQLDAWPAANSIKTRSLLTVLWRKSKKANK